LMVTVTLVQYEFGLRSCFHENFEFIIARVCLG
jgi:mlo protein